MNYKERLKNIQAVIFDFDGVLTDGMVLLYENEIVRNFNSKDSYAIQLANKMGLRVFIISGGNSLVAKEKLLGLGVEEVVLSAKNKLESFRALAGERNLNPENCLYMGDDIPDINLLKEVHIGCCPQDAVPEVKSVCNYISDKMGGKGAVRDVIEQVLKIQGKWMTKEAFEW